MTMKKMVVLTVLVLLVGCGNSSQSKTVANVATPQTITLEKGVLAGTIHGIEIGVSGNINGDATIALLMNNRPYKTENITGNVAVTWAGDWYSDSAVVTYVPDNVREGQLTVTYQFRD